MARLHRTPSSKNNRAARRRKMGAKNKTHVGMDAPVRGRPVKLPKKNQS